MVVTGATNVVVQQAGLIILPLGGRLAVLFFFQDRAARAVGTGAEGQRLGAGSVQTFGAVAFAQAEDADAGAEPLFGMRARTQHDLEQRRSVIADCRRFALDPLMRPVTVAPMRTWHVLGHCGGSIRAQVAQM